MLLTQLEAYTIFNSTLYLATAGNVIALHVQGRHAKWVISTGISVTVTVISTYIHTHIPYIYIVNSSAFNCIDLPHLSWPITCQLANYLVGRKGDETA